MVRLLDRIDGRAKAEIEELNGALFKLGREQYGRNEDVDRRSPVPGLRYSPPRPGVWLAHGRGISRRR